MENLSPFTDVISEQNYKQLFSQAPAPIAIYKGRQMLYVFVNEAYSKIFNHREILGKTVREAFPELEGQPYYSILEEVFDTGRPYYAMETPALIDDRNDGHLTTHYYNLVYTSYKNQQGTIEGVMAFGHDVTTQVEAKMRQLEGEQRFKNIVEQSSDPILVLKGEDMVLDVANQTLLKLWNVSKEAIGRKFLDILPEMKNQGFFELLLDVYHNGVTHYGYETPAVFKRAGGIEEKVFFNFVYQPYRETDGSVSGVLVLATDVTGQVKAKHELQNAENNFRNIVLQAPVGIAILKGEELIVEVANQSFLQLIGKTNKTFTNIPLWEMIPEARTQEFDDILKKVLRSASAFHGKEYLVTLNRNGIVEQIYVDFVYHPIKELDNSVSRVMVIAFEATDKVIARKKIEESEKELQKRVEERTIELQTKNIELEQFAYVSSHDLQEPLRKIRMYSSMIKDKDYENLSENSKVRIEKIMDAVKRMSTSLTDLLNFSSLSKEEQFSMVDLNEILTSVLKDLELVIEQKAAVIHCDNLPSVLAIPLQMQQLFYNLVNNALKFSRPGIPPRVHISVRHIRGAEIKNISSLKESEEYYEIDVSDNGIGFESIYAEKIFAMFQRLHDNKTFSGTGIGLALCKKVCLNHGGDIYAESDTSKGSHFYIFLPGAGLK